MDSSRRAVESYWRSRMIDAATTNEDKVTPVYKLEEICELLRSSDITIVKEVSEFVLKRLEHKSPIVKQKALRLIKYCVAKSGADFHREMQRHSVAVRQLLHYRGQPDPLKGDALNKAVRDTAKEAVDAIFLEQESKPSPATNLSRRIEGFGNTNFHMPTDEKKSFISEVVDIGSASIKQGISSLTQGHSFKNQDNGNYRGPNLQKSLTLEKDNSDRYVPVDIPSDYQSGLGTSRNASAVSWNSEARNGDSNLDYSDSKTREERLLDTIVTSGGVRLQPTRDAIQVFLIEAAKLDALSLSRALDAKLQMPQWQVRMKAVCVLDSIIRKKDDEPFSIIASYFSDNKDAIVRCCESPQSSLRERANKVLILLGGEQAISIVGSGVNSSQAAKEFVEMPNLIDTGDSELDNFFGTDDSSYEKIDQNVEKPINHAPLIDDLFGGGTSYSASPSQPENVDDPFADVSFHTEGRDHSDDIFNGMNVSQNQMAPTAQTAGKTNGIEIFDAFGANPRVYLGEDVHKNDVSDLIAGLSVNVDAPKTNTQKGTFILEKYPATQVSNDATGNLFGSQAPGIAANGASSMPANLLPGMMFNPAFVPQPLNYAQMVHSSQMGNLLHMQQQLLALEAHFQDLRNLNAQNVTAGQAAASVGSQSSPIPDIFHANFASQPPTSTMNNLKKEDSKAFDFISDHLASARDLKRVA